MWYGLMSSHAHTASSVCLIETIYVIWVEKIKNNWKMENCEKKINQLLLLWTPNKTNGGNGLNIEQLGKY